MTAVTARDLGRMTTPTTATAATRNETALEQAIGRWNAGDLEGYLAYDATVRLHGYTPDALDRAQVAQFSPESSQLSPAPR